MSQWLDILNDEQRSAVELTEGYVCLHAGAGTGKTRTLTYRYAYLINEFGISPRSVWCVTFTNKAASEMKVRVQQLCGNVIGNPFITTFHGFCALFLREEIMAIGWPKTFTICDVSDVKDLLRPLYAECGIDGKKLSLKKAWEFIDAQKENLDYISDLIGADSTVLLKRSEAATEDSLKLFWRYLFAQRTTYSLDFDDLILLTLHILKNFPEVRERWQKRLEYILVDEFQDIGRDQYLLVEILSGYNHNLFVVGDPDQTIYSFRGARVEYFNSFVEDHPRAAKLNLTYNYRSQGAILQAAFSVISHNVDEDRKPLVAMRQDITLDDMIVSHDPNGKQVEALDPEIARQIAKSSTLHQNSFTKEKHHSYKNFKAQHQLSSLGLQATNHKVLGFAGHTGAGGSLPVDTRNDRGVGAGSNYALESENYDWGCNASMREHLSEVPDSQGRALSMKPIMTHASSVYSEADYVVDCIEQIRSLNPDDSIAILYRAHYVALQLENALVARHIPYNVVGDVRFFDRKEIRDVLSYIRLRLNLDDDVALRRIINVPPRGFGKKRMEKLELIAKGHNCSLFKALLLSTEDSFLFAKTTKTQEFVSVMQALADAPLGNLVNDFEFVINNTGYEEWIKLSGEDERLDNIATLKNYLSDFKKTQDDEVNLADFIANVTLMTSADESAPDQAVRLMTVHNAKGLEFDYVFVVSLNEAVFPSKKAINELNVEEERRLMYVAMTRAKKQLFLSEAGGFLQNRQDPQAKIQRLPSRFLSEVQADEVVEIGAAMLKEQASQDTLVYEERNDTMAVGEHFEHKLLGEGIVREVRAFEGEYLVFYPKLGRERTLSFTATNFKRLTESAPAPATALSSAPESSALPLVVGAPVHSSSSATAESLPHPAPCSLKPSLSCSEPLEQCLETELPHPERQAKRPGVTLSYAQFLAQAKQGKSSSHQSAQIAKAAVAASAHPERSAYSARAERSQYLVEAGSSAPASQAQAALSPSKSSSAPAMPWGEPKDNWAAAQNSLLPEVHCSRVLSASEWLAEQAQPSRGAPDNSLFDLAPHVEDFSYDESAPVGAAMESEVNPWGQPDFTQLAAVPSWAAYAPLEPELEEEEAEAALSSFAEPRALVAESPIPSPMSFAEYGAQSRPAPAPAPSPAPAGRTVQAKAKAQSTAALSAYQVPSFIAERAHKAEEKRMASAASAINNFKLDVGQGYGFKDLSTIKSSLKGHNPYFDEDWDDEDED